MYNGNTEDTKLDSIINTCYINAVDYDFKKEQE